ncbi:hypothetical protein SAM9427_22395 [Streptomyces sp. ETH9427]|uniref:hypothetical protein n=1 Tax=unclassified Streptomyces TaxID=2593676 RepID=UPI000E0A0441|nr:MULTISPECIES: hypothetical protein [unclassified Streptomyces]AXI88246.1 hypothetical protein SAM9427_22395 [Streptomyces sp. ETH9427]
MHIGTGVVHVHPGGGILSTPRFVISGSLVIVGPYAGAEEHERHLLVTEGAGNWQDSGEDEFRFDANDGRLVSLLLQVPDGASTADASGDGWAMTSVEASRLQLAQAEGMSVPRCVSTRVTAPGGMLLCTTEAGSTAEADGRRRLRVAPDVDLLFSGSVYAGWMLYNPSAYLSAGWDVTTPSRPDPELAERLAEYLTLGDGRLLEALEDGDSAIVDALRALTARIPADRGNERGRRILRDCIDEFLDFWQ